MIDKIQSYVYLYHGEVTLSVAVTKNLKRQKERLKNFGDITVSTGKIDDEDCFWDNIEFFNNMTYKSFLEECKEELIEKGFDPEPIFKSIKKLLKRAFKLNILKNENN